jgi:hypothetical protein
MYQNNAFQGLPKYIHTYNKIWTFGLKIYHLATLSCTYVTRGHSLCTTYIFFMTNWDRAGVLFQVQICSLDTRCLPGRNSGMVLYLFMKSWFTIICFMDPHIRSKIAASVEWWNFLHLFEQGDQIGSFFAYICTYVYFGQFFITVVAQILGNFSK